MVETLTLGVGLFVLLAGPFVTYAILSLDGRSSSSRPRDREDTVPSTATGNYPSRTIPGGNPRDVD